MNHFCDENENVFKDERDHAKFLEMRSKIISELEVDQQGGSVSKNIDYQSEIVKLVNEVVLALFGFENNNTLFYQCYKSQFDQLFENLVISI